MATRKNGDQKETKVSDRHSIIYLQYSVDISYNYVKASGTVIYGAVTYVINF